MKTVEERARERNFKVLGAMSRVTATAYFEKAGFRIVGIPTPHLGITHLVWMEKALA